MKKILNSLIIMIAVLIIMPIGVKAAVSLGVDCSGFEIDSTNSARKYSDCVISLSAPEGTSGAYTIELNYNNPNEYSDFAVVEKGNGWVSNIIKSNNGGSIRFLPYGGQYGTFKVATIRIYGDASLSEAELGGTISQSILHNPNQAEEGSVLLYDVCNVFQTNFATFYKSGKYIYSVYNFDFDDTYHSSTCGKLGAFKATIDKTTIPEGLELVDGYMNSDDATMTFNKENGEFLIDFNELTIESEEVPNENPTPNDPFGKFTIKYEITNSTLLEDWFDINVINISYINMENKNVQIYETDFLSTNFMASDKGDWNDDGEFNLVDLVAYRMYLVDADMSDYYQGDFNEGRLDLVDLNNDGKIDLLDLVVARKILVGLPFEPIE